MSRGWMAFLVAGVAGALALPPVIRADNDNGNNGNQQITVTITGGVSAGPGQTKIGQVTYTVNGNGVITTQPAVVIAPATQPAGGAVAPATQPALQIAVPANQPGVVHMHIIVSPATQPAGNKDG